MLQFDLIAACFKSAECPPQAADQFHARDRQSNAAAGDPARTPPPRGAKAARPREATSSASATYWPALKRRPVE